MTGFPRHHGHAAPAATARSPATVPIWQILTLGLLTVLFGIAVLVWPDTTLRLLGFLTGLWLVATGGVRLVAAFDREHGMVGRLLSGAVGAVLLIVGVACMANAATGLAALALYLGLAWLLRG